MKTRKTIYFMVVFLIAVAIVLGFMVHSIVLASTQAQSQEAKTAGVLPNEQANKQGSSVPTSIKQVTDKKDLEIVSKTPEFFTYALASLSILLSAITLIVGILTGIGVTLMFKLAKERKDFEAIRKSVEEEQKKAREILKSDCDKLIEGLHRTAFGLVTLHNAKNQLRELLSSADPSFDIVYKEVQKTVKFPDEECVRLYAQVLTKYERSIDMVRLVRNGLMQYARNPTSGDKYCE